MSAVRCLLLGALMGGVGCTAPEDPDHTGDADTDTDVDADTDPDTDTDTAFPDADATPYPVLALSGTLTYQSWTDWEPRCDADLEWSLETHAPEACPDLGAGVCWFSAPVSASVIRDDGVEDCFSGASHPDEMGWTLQPHGGQDYAFSLQYLVREGSDPDLLQVVWDDGTGWLRKANLARDDGSSGDRHNRFTPSWDADGLGLSLVGEREVHQPYGSQGFTYEIRVSGTLDLTLVSP